MFALALLRVFVPMGFPSTLACGHAAVKPTNFGTFLNHNNLGTDTSLPTQLDDSREDLSETSSSVNPLCTGDVLHSWSQLA